MKKRLRRTWLEIDLNAIIHNVKFAKARIGEDVAFMAIVKADAYAHGAPVVAKTLDPMPEVDYFGVSSYDEAMQLRTTGVEKPILIMGWTAPELAEEISDNNLTQTIYSASYAKELCDYLPADKKLKGHVKIDTGMSRLGIICHKQSDFEGAAREAAEIYKMPKIIAEGIFTHFAESEDVDKTFTELQFSLFTSLLELLRKDGITFKYAHCSNSGGTVYHDNKFLTMVRNGSTLCGYYSNPDVPVEGLDRSLQFKSVVTQIKEVDADTYISYNRTHKTTRPTKLAVIACGYADGFSRDLSGKAEILINGKRAPILGRICMDQMIADITDIENVTEGQTVTIFGLDNGVVLDPTEHANKIGTLTIVMLCNLGKRVPRIYFKDGVEVEFTNYIYK